MPIKCFSKWKSAVLAMMVITALATLRNAPTTKRKKVETGPLLNSEPSIPNFPNETRIGEPPVIPTRFLVEEADACVRAGEDVEMVVYVHSALSRVKQRQQTRLTWANATTPKMVVVYMVGRAKNDEERKILQDESELYHDIVQGDYPDYYNLLTYKALSSLYWVTKNCPHVPWTVHADDDLLIDTFILDDLIQDFNNSSDRDKLHCRILEKIKVFRKGKWKVSRQELRLRYYPPFCQGTLWLLPTSQIPKLLDGVQSVKYLWVDDAYITGLLARYAGIFISPIPDYRFGVGGYSDNDLGKKVMWFHIKRDHSELWPDILKYHNATDLS